MADEDRMSVMAVCRAACVVTVASVCLLWLAWPGCSGEQGPIASLEVRIMPGARGAGWSIECVVIPESGGVSAQWHAEKCTIEYEETVGSEEAGWGICEGSTVGSLGGRALVEENAMSLVWDPLLPVGDVSKWRVRYSQVFRNPVTETTQAMSTGWIALEDLMKAASEKRR